MVNQELLSIFAKKEATRFKLKVGVFLLLIQNNQVLLLRRYRTGIDDGKYVVPMGGHDGLEPLTSSLIREAKEEANIIVRPEHLQMCHLMHRFYPMPQNLSFEQIDVYFKAETYEGVIENREPHKCDELKFYPLNKLPYQTIDCVRQAIECMQREQHYSEFGWSNQNEDL